MILRYRLLTFIVGLILLTSVNDLYSQNPRETRVFAYNVKRSPTIGFKGGVLLSTITGDQAIDQYAKKIGPQIGVTGAVYPHPMLSIRAELNYESKGGKFANHDMKMKLNYVTLPIYLKFNFTKDPEIYIYGGGYASYLISAKTEGTYERLEDVESINEDILNHMNPYDVGVIGGLGVQGRYNQWIDIFLDFRYTLGFVNLDNGTAEYRYNFNKLYLWPEQDLDKPKNKAFMLTTGFVVYLNAR